MDGERPPLRVPPAAEQAPANQAVNGVIHVFEGPLLRGEIPLSVFVASGSPGNRAFHAAQPDHFIVTRGQTYRNIFPSYSRKDERIVRACEAIIEASGDRFLRDVRVIRAGQDWRPEVHRLIEESDVFQLFWSRDAAHSAEVEREWRYAMTLLPTRPTFIRPVYWTPRPHPIPLELLPIDFGYLDPEMLGPERARRLKKYLD